MQYKLFQVRASCCTEQREEAGTVDKLEEACIRPGQECVFTMASNLLKCSLIGEAEIRMLLKDLDLEWQSHKAGGKETSFNFFWRYCLKCISSRLNMSGFFRLLKTVFKSLVILIWLPPQALRFECLWWFIRATVVYIVWRNSSIRALLMII